MKGARSKLGNFSLRGFGRRGIQLHKDRIKIFSAYFTKRTNKFEPGLEKGGKSLGKGKDQGHLTTHWINQSKMIPRSTLSSINPECIHHQVRRARLGLFSTLVVHFPRRIPPSHNVSCMSMCTRSHMTCPNCKSEDIDWIWKLGTYLTTSPARFVDQISNHESFCLSPYTRLSKKFRDSTRIIHDRV